MLQVHSVSIGWKFNRGGEKVWTSFFFHQKFNMYQQYWLKQSLLQNRNSNRCDMFFFVFQLSVGRVSVWCRMSLWCRRAWWAHGWIAAEACGLEEKTTCHSESVRAPPQATVPASISSSSCALSPWMFFFFCLAVCSFCPFPLHWPCRPHTGWAAVAEFLGSILDQWGHCPSSLKFKQPVYSALQLLLFSVTSTVCVTTILKYHSYMFKNNF